MERMVKNSLRKLGTITLAAALGASVLAGCGSNAGGQQSTGAAGSTDKNNTIRVAVMTGQPDQYQIFVGQQQGFFESYMRQTAQIFARLCYFFDIPDAFLFPYMI